MLTSTYTLVFRDNATGLGGAGNDFNATGSTDADYVFVVCEVLNGSSLTGQADVSINF